MNLNEMSQTERTIFYESLIKNRGALLNKLRELEPESKVFVYSDDHKTYVDKFEVWQEGHEYRHFISLSISNQDKYNKPMLIRTLIDELLRCYEYKEQDYVDTVPINVTNEKGQSTANFDFKVENGNLYLIGNKPLYEYYQEYGR